MAVASSVPVSFDQIYADHDKDPMATAEILRGLAGDGAVQPQDHRRFAWLVNHLMGEKLSQWETAAATLEKVVSHSAEAPCLTHLAVASMLAGHPVRTMALLPRIADLAEAPLAAAIVAVHLGVLQFAQPTDTVAVRATAFCGVLDLLQTLEGMLGKLATPIAGNLNNVTSRLLDDDSGDIQDPLYRDALMRGARAAKALWLVNGNWINHERAEYLIALCGNRLHDYQAAKEAAERGLQAIADGGSEDVDRAFLLLELSRGERGLGHAQAATVARDEAMRLAQAFDPELRSWFDSRATA